MSRHDPVVSIKQMLDYAQKAMSISRGRKRADLDEDLTFNLALTRAVEVIGEAADRVPREIQENHPEIAGEEIIGMRNRLIHGYDDVDADFLWGVVRDDLPKLIGQLKQLL
jgi:uncharacterized protein with HEPN domain